MSSSTKDSCQKPATGQVRVPFGLSTADGRIYSPREVNRGKACECVCPACKEPLIARLPLTTNRVAHFAHAPGADCVRGFETAVHKAAKQLIAEEGALYFPEARARLELYDAFHHRHGRDCIVEYAGLRKISIVQVELAVEDIRPDVVVTTLAGFEVCVEIAVTHFISNEKRTKLQKLQYPTIEFDLSAQREFTWDSLKASLLEGQAPCAWVVHPRVDNLLAKWHEELAPVLRAANQEYKEQTAVLRLEKEKSAAARRQRDEEVRQLRQRHSQERAKAQAFKSAQVADKVALVCKSFQSTAMPASLRIPVPGWRSFGVPDPLLWQAALFRGLIHRAAARGSRQITKESAFAWLSNRFEVRPEFEDSPAIAVWKYLCALANKGALRQQYGQSFSILVADLSAFETLQAYTSGQISENSGLAWASTTHWPERNTALTLAANHASASKAPLNWENVATIFQSVAEHPIEEVVAHFSTQIQIKALITFWISAGFLRLT